MTRRRHDDPAALDAVLEEYARLAPFYDRRWSFYIGATTRETLSRLRIDASDSVLDVGCGTGALLQQLSVSFPQARLVGVDPSSEMLGIAANKLSRTVQLEQGWAEEIPFPDDTFDTVVSCNVFHYIRQPQAALVDMSRVLRPGGTLVITDWCDDYLFCRMCDAYLRVFNAAHFRTYRAGECRRMLDSAGARETKIERYKITWLWGLMTATVEKSRQDGEGYSADAPLPTGAH